MTSLLIIIACGLAPSITMPTKIKLKVIQARDLPIMDHANQTTDAYVEVKLSDIYSEKTEIAHKTLNPRWEEDFVIEVSHDGDIMKHPLEIKVWDRDTISSDDVIGGVLIDLSNLLLSEANEINGWFPIYDTLRGVRGELKLSVSVLFFGKATGFGVNSTDAVLFSFGSIAPPNMVITQILGFVEELLVDDDPEYDWKDQFRSSRSSNQSRQYVLYKLSAKLRREIGAKVVGLGGNAVIGFKKYVDYESEGSIVMRGFGTAVSLQKARPTQLAPPSGSVGSPSLATSADEDIHTSAPYLPTIVETPLDMEDLTSSTSTLSTTLTHGASNPNGTSSGLLPRSEKPGSISRADPHHFSVLKMHAGDIQLLTISQFPPPTVVRIAGIATAHSVKIVPKGLSEEKGRTTRDRWWSELRAEVKSHARFLGCQYVLGYRETTVFYGDVILLTATGTAANLKVLTIPTPTVRESMVDILSSVPESEVAPISSSPMTNTSSNAPYFPSVGSAAPSVYIGANPLASTIEILPSVGVGGGLSSSYQGSYMNQYASQFGIGGTGVAGGGTIGSIPTAAVSATPQQIQWQHNACGVCHIPYKIEKAPYKLKLERCAVCGRKTVPEVLLSTIEPPPGLAIIGQGQLIEAYDARPKKKTEDSASQIGEAIPFLEFDLYKQLMNKLKMLGMNACFKLTMRISVGDTVIVGHMQATAMCLAALPRPMEMKVAKSLSTSDASLRSKTLAAQIAKLSAESTRYHSEAPIELYPDSSLPFLWRRASGVGSVGSVGSAGSMLGGGGFQVGSYGSTTSLDEYPPHIQHLQLQQQLNASGQGSSHHHGTAGDAGVFTDLHLHHEDLPESSHKERQQPSYLVELENELDEELMALIVSDHPMPTDFAMCSTQALPGTKAHNWHAMQLLTVVRTLDWSPTKSAAQLRKAFAAIFHSLYAHLSFRMHLIRPCAIVGIKTELRISDADEIQVTFTGMVLHSTTPWKFPALSAPSFSSSSNTSGNSAHTSSSTKEASTSSAAHSTTPPSKKTKSSRADKDKEKEKEKERDKDREKDKDSHHTSPGSTAEDISAPSDSSTSRKKKKIKKMGSLEVISTPSSEEHNSASKESTSTKESKKDKDIEAKDKESGSSKSHHKDSNLKESFTSKHSSSLSSKEPSSSKDSKSRESKSSPTTPRKKSEKDLTSRLAEDSKETHSSSPSFLASDLEDPTSLLQSSTGVSQPMQAQNQLHPSLANFNPSSGLLGFSRPLHNLSAFTAASIPHVEITPLNYVPGTILERFVGTIHLSFIRESFSLREAGGMSVFTQNLVLEAQRIARAHVLALGGNVLASYNMELTQKFKQAKNQGYCLLTITGDAILARSAQNAGIGYKKLAKAQTIIGMPANTNLSLAANSTSGSARPKP